MDSLINVLSVNCHGLGDSKKRRDVFDYLRNCKKSIYFLQDTHFTEKLEPYVAAEWGYQCFFSSHTSNSRGVAILFNSSFELKVLDSYKGEQGNYVMVRIKVKEVVLLLINIYGPNRDNPEFYKNLSDKI